MKPPALHAQRVLAVIPTFKPTVNVTHLVADLTKQGVDVLILDDASDSAESGSVLSGCIQAGAQVVIRRENKGIGESLEFARQRAIAEEYDYLLTVDQDARLSGDYVSRGVCRFGSSGTDGRCLNVGAVVPPNDVRLLGTSAPSWLSDCAALFAIQSGTIYDVAALSAVGAFRVDFVMDVIDHEYCCRLRDAGFVILVDPELRMVHQLGDPVVRRFFGKSVRVTNHSAMRKYWQFRNRLILAWEVRRSDPSSCLVLLKAQAIQLLLVLLMEQKKRSSFVSIYRGLRDGLLTCFRGR